VKIEIGVLIAVAGVLISAATFFIGRQTAAKVDSKVEGERWGELNANIKHILKSISGIEEKEIRNAEKVEHSIKRLHERIDEHINEYHKHE
jgi:hypothetical protein